MRRVIGYLFLVLMLAEVGVHHTLCHGTHSADRSNAQFVQTEGQDAQFVSAPERQHEDPCDTLVLSGGTQRDPQPSNGHDTSRNSAFLGSITFGNALQRVFSETPMLLRMEIYDSRPPDLPFQPPKLT